MVIVNLMPREGVKIKGVDEGDPVGIANGTADEKGNFSAPVGPLAILMTFFQAGFDDTKMKPDFSTATPLPPGTYQIQAVGTESEATAEATLTLQPPPKKK